MKAFLHSSTVARRQASAVITAAVLLTIAVILAWPWPQEKTKAADESGLSQPVCKNTSRLTVRK